jgi:peptidyl-tRNA hydrolase, PTH1 family
MGPPLGRPLSFGGEEFQMTEMSGSSLRIIVGLGNPGPEHLRTRHNAGFWFVDELARRQNVEFRDYRKYSGETAKVTIAGRELILLKPTTYMNKSGISIRALMDFFKVPAEQILVAHDELDLPVGTVRLKQGGGAGGHNGLRDAITHLGESFWRLRLGIGHPGNKNEVLDYVLSRPPRGEEDMILETVEFAADCLPLLLEQGAERAMTKLHSRGIRVDAPMAKD